MASKEHKIVRKAKALNNLLRLAGELAKHLDIEVPAFHAVNISRDPELTEIQRIESINELLTKLLEGRTEPTKQSAAKSTKHGANK